MGEHWEEHVDYISCSKCQNKKQFVYKTCSECSELGIFMYWTGNSMNNLLSYCGLVDATPEKDLPVRQIAGKAELT